MGDNMQLSLIGEIANFFWYEIPIQYPFINLGEFGVMPNHVHGILLIDKSDELDRAQIIQLSDNADGSKHAEGETRSIASLQSSPTSQVISSGQIPMPCQSVGGIAKNKNPMLHENISRIIRWYKGRCTYVMRRINIDFAWQPRFHDRLIRNEDEYQRISDYIVTNPENWNCH